MNTIPKWFRLALFDTSEPANRIEVKNVSPSPSYEGSAIGEWEAYKHKKATQCARCGKVLNKDEDKVGGHVCMVGGLSIDMYIVPLCKDCNHPSVTESFEVSKSDMVRIQDIKRRKQ